MSERQKTLGKNLLVGIATALVSASITLNMSQASIYGDVRDLKKDVAALSSADVAANNRIDRVAANLEKLIQQNTELITLIRVQNQLKP